MTGSTGNTWRSVAAGLLGLCLSHLALTDEAKCQRIAEPTPRMICEDPQLKMLDGMVTKVYEDLMQRLPAVDGEALAGEQMQWISRRDGFLCPEVYSCLSTYNERLVELRRRKDAITSLKPEQRAMQKRLRTLLARMEENWEQEPVAGVTQLPDIGLRGLYLRSKLTPASLREWFGVEPYLSGPHKPDRYDFRSHQAFGHYNPKFLTALGDWLAFFTANPLTKPLAIGFYDNQMMDIVPAYHRMHQYLSAPENAQWVEQITKRYQEAITQGQGLFRDGYHYPYREFQEIALKIEKQEGLSVHELTTAGPFWLRRRMDGSEAEIAALIDRVRQAFDTRAGAAPAP